MSIIKRVFKKEKSSPDKTKAKKQTSLVKKTSPKKSGQSKKKIARLDSSAFRVLTKPLISEKATFLNGENKYVFEVSIQATKKTVTQAVKDVYGIKPTGVNIINLAGKARRYGRTTGRTKNRKKAIVTLPSGQSIQVYEGV